MATTPKQKGMSRREFLPKAAAGRRGGLGAAGVIGYELPPKQLLAQPEAGALARAVDARHLSSPEVRTFVTRPDLRPPAVTVTTVDSQTASRARRRYIFVAPTNYVPGARCSRA